MKSDSSELDLTGIQQDDDDDDDLDLTGIEQEGEGEDTMKGGAPSSSNSSEDDLYIVKNKERAKNTNPFLMELQRKDPDVILQGKDGRSNIYSRSCQSYRQPVVLTAFGPQVVRYFGSMSPSVSACLTQPDQLHR